MKIPRQGATVLQFVVEESRGDAWRPVVSSSSQVEALAELDRFATSYARRVVQVVAVRLPGEVGFWTSFWTSPARAIAKALAPLVAGDPEYAGDRYAEDFPRPRGVTP